MIRSDGLDYSRLPLPAGSRAYCFRFTVPGLIPPPLRRELSASLFENGGTRTKLMDSNGCDGTIPSLGVFRRLSVATESTGFQPVVFKMLAIVPRAPSWATWPALLGFRSSPNPRLRGRPVSGARFGCADAPGVGLCGSPLTSALEERERNTLSRRIKRGFVHSRDSLKALTV